MTSYASDIVIFGACGDLAQRKLLPALYQLSRSGLIDPATRIIGVARDSQTTESFIAVTKQSLAKRVSEDELIEADVDTFVARIQYLRLDLLQPDGYAELANKLAETDFNRVFYYAIAAPLFAPTSKHLHESGCINENCRVVVEKPLGYDHESSAVIEDEIALYFEERQIYRIDHYLGKETVQNLLALRFANRLFGSQWNTNHISHIEITVAEKVGIEGRWGYFDEAGQMRDMVQNHLLQLLCLTAMDPPMDLSANAIRNEKVKVLQALAPVRATGPDKQVIRGRYAEGVVDRESVPGYLEEEGANQGSHTETYIAIKAEIRNWRWAGVPFYLRTGKRMKQKLSQIVVHFKSNPHFIFNEYQRSIARNRLTIRLQPEEGISLKILNKDQDLTQNMNLRSGNLRLDFANDYGTTRIPDAYERLLLEVVRGNQNLFVRRDEIEHAWKWCDSVIEQWQNDQEEPQSYPAGSWGPKGADLLIMKDGNCWQEDL